MQFLCSYVLLSKNMLLCSCVPAVASGKAERLCLKKVILLLCYYVLNKLLCPYV